MQIPDFFKLKTADPERSKFRLDHSHTTTLDFFRCKPLVCREVVPGDDLTIDASSVVRFFPMPFPTFGRIKFSNRAFFVPYRTIMEGFTDFIEDRPYADATAAYKIASVPYTTNKELAKSLTDTTLGLEMIEAVTGFFWRHSLDPKRDVYYLTDSLGRIIHFYSQGPSSKDFILVRNESGQMWHYNYIDFDFTNVSGNDLDSFDEITVEFFEAQGTYTDEGGTERETPIIYSLDQDDIFDFCILKPLVSLYNQNYECQFYEGEMTIDDSDEDFTIPSVTFGYSRSSFDIVYNGSPFVWTSRGRRWYDLLISLGYRVDFTSNNLGEFTNERVISMGKLLAYLKVILDWYWPSDYATGSLYYSYFRGVGTLGAGRFFDSTTLLEIANEGAFFKVSYDRDYFTSAWRNPTSPNSYSGVASSLPTPVVIDDITYKSGSGTDAHSTVFNSPQAASGGWSKGSANGTPVVSASTSATSSVFNLSYYMIESLRGLTNYMRRHQLVGYRTLDRYLAEHGVKLDDAQLNRASYLGGYEYNAEIKDIMSTSDTDFASLGDYAGKAFAYSDGDYPQKFFHLNDCKEFGFIIVISSVVPKVGYVQGIMRENLHTKLWDFYKGDFDNLGTQPITHDELFADGAMSRLSQKVPATVTNPTGIFGFAPRYMEYKVGYDFLTGDFAIPSRRQGLDAFHLYRLFDNEYNQSVGFGFQLGDQAQYDRIFNNTSDEYDHMYSLNSVIVSGSRRMK